MPSKEFKELQNALQDMLVLGAGIVQKGKRINPLDFYKEDEPREEVREKKKHKNHKGRDDR